MCYAIGSVLFIVFVVWLCIRLFGTKKLADATLCPSCGNKVLKSANVCPTCKAALTPTEGPLANADGVCTCGRTDGHHDSWCAKADYHREYHRR